MENSSKSRITPKRWGIRTLAIFASTFAAIDLLKQEYFLSVAFAIAWLLIVITEKNIYKQPADTD